ncbi:hypothetical protein AcV5_001967 [Taiwanofungus camphoratus]|nr:hypothetical protein AcV5_001967 [Antrodia cinnamomea]KAI0960729.1 hypothetical protein AcV7_000031 [Antrodia cinnamomea]
MSNVKRTRSQLTLPEFDINKLGRSPLKDARTAARNNHHISSNVVISCADSEDEILLSPRKQPKRPSSPLKDTALSSERLIKRSRLVNNQPENHPLPVRSKKPYSTSVLNDNPGLSEPIQRSQSVPNYPSIPHIDFNQVPRSPTKVTTPFRIFSVTLEPAANTVPDVNIKELRVSRPENPSDVSLCPATPTSATLASQMLPPPLSPLTPLPSTPHPLRYKSDSSGHDHMAHDHMALDLVSLATNINNISEDRPASSSRPATGFTSLSRLPVPRPTPSHTPSSPERFSRHPCPRSKAKVHKSGCSAGPIPLGGRMTRSATLRQRENRRKDESTGGPSKASASSVSRQSGDTKKVLTSDSPSTGNAPALRSNSGVSRKRPISFSLAQPSSAAKSNPSSPVKCPATNFNTSSMAHSQYPSVSLAHLSVALEKLSMPPPPRPNTSMGFHDAGRSNLQGNPAHGSNQTIMDDVYTNSDTELFKAPVNTEIHRDVNKRDVLGPASVRSLPLKKAATFSALSTTPRQSVLMPPPPPPPSNSMTRRINIHSGVVAGKPRGNIAFGRTRGHIIHGHSRSESRTRIFGVGAQSGILSQRRVVQKASRETSLPVVQGSPVKGGTKGEGCADAKDMGFDGLPAENEQLAVFENPISTDAAGVYEAAMTQIGSQVSDKSGTTHRRDDASRRASLASQHLSQSLSSLPETPPSFATSSQISAPSTTPGKGKVILRAASSSYPSDSQTSTHNAPGATTKAAGSGAHVSAKKVTESANAPVASGSPGSLAVLKECTIFVDVRTDDGDDAGALFVDMLKGMGARVLTRVGQTCTHIVYKNGLMSTVTRYRLLTEPRPFVVGIAWVVECAEQRSRVNETEHLVSLDGVNIAGVNKRRRSMLPKQICNSDPSSSSQNVVSPKTLGSTPGDSDRRGERSSDMSPPSAWSLHSN